MTYQIYRDVPKPERVRKEGKTTEIYPASKLAVGEHFVVPKSEMKPGDTPAKFRNRVNNAVRSYKQRANRALTEKPDYNAESFVPVDFSIILLGEPTDPQNQRWEEGDVGVWRDS